ncbi:MAG: arsenate reductase family protein [Eubacteriaceae bacterium]|jgi:arsenate reductase|nr:arsenate reductase family protein [Eubacteriaceae bacterium]
MILLCYTRCSTCKAVKAELNEAGVKYEEREISTDNPSFEELSLWWKESGLPLKRFFNTSGLLYKKLGLKDKLADMTEEEQLRLLATDGLLVKRPLMVDGDKIRVGRKDILDEYL